MAPMMNTLSSFLRHIFMPRLIPVAAPTTPATHFSILFSTLVEKNSTPVRSPFADFAANTFNFSPADIALMLKKVPSLDNPKTLQNVERVVHLLTKYGSTQHHIAHIMRSQPHILPVSAEKLLEPKILLFKDRLGIEEKELPRLLIKAPRLLSLNLQDGLLPKITFFESLFGSQNLLLKAVKRHPYILTLSVENNLRPSLAFWEGCGLQKEELARFLSSKPSLFSIKSLTPLKFDLIRKMGISEESKMYKNVLSVVASLRMETLESKMDDFREWGLSAEEIWELFRTSPVVFTLSKNTLRGKMEYVVRTMELPPNSVVQHSAYLKSSLEKVVKPRFVVFQRMKSLAGVEHLKSKQMYSLLAMSEADFVNEILKGHPELETLYVLHRKPIPNV